MLYDNDDFKHVIKIRRKHKKVEPITNVRSPFDDDKKKVESSDIDILNQLISMRSNSNNTEKEHKKKKKKDKKIKKDVDKKTKNKEKKKSKHMLEVFDDIFESDENKKPKKKKNREAEDFYEKRFRGSLMLLKGLMEEVNETALDSKDHIRQLKAAPGRGTAMAIANQSSTVSTLLNTKLSIIKEITTVNKSISDLEIRNETQKMKNKSDADKSKDGSVYLDDMFEKIMNNEIPIPDFDDDDLSKYSLSKSSLDKRIDSLVDDGTIEFNDSERAFKYEAMGDVEIAILYNTSSKKTKKWEFVAIGPDGDEINDYPLPTKKSCGRMAFDLENDSAKDKLGNVYRLIYINDNMGISGDYEDDYDDEEEYE